MANNQNELDKLLDKWIDDAEKDIDVVHAKRLKALLNRISTMYEKYEVDGQLTYAEMAKYNRLQKELTFIEDMINDDYKYLIQYIQKLTQNQYIENYYRSAYLYEYEAQMKLGFGLLSPEVIQAAITNPIKEMTLPLVMATNRSQIVTRIKRELTQGLQAGESYSSMAKRIKGAVGFSNYKARMVARTEAHRAQQIGRIDSSEQAAKRVKMTKMWDATLDTNTRKGHRKLDGKEVKRDANFKSPNGGVGPSPGQMHNASDDINCRCTVVFLVNGRKPNVKRARQGDGSTKVIPYQTYEEWEEKRLKGV